MHCSMGLNWLDCDALTSLAIMVVIDDIPSPMYLSYCLAQVSLHLNAVLCTFLLRGVPSGASPDHGLQYTAATVLFGYQFSFLHVFSAVLEDARMDRFRRPDSHVS